MTRAAIHSSVESVEQGGGGVYVLSLASALSQWCDVDLFFQGAVGQSQIDRFMPPSSQGVRIREEPRASTTRFVGEARKALLDWPYDIVVIQSTRIPRATLNRHAYLLCEFPFQERVPWDDRVRLGRFEHVVANSVYTARWLERRWGRSATVLYPVVPPIAPKSKRPYILGVGRFLAGGRSKQQLEMVDVFRQLCQRGLSGWELHLAGYAQDSAYVERVRGAAKGLPVQLHLGLTRAELEELYGVSSIFWHATGFGADPEREPGRMEHFGIVTAEAMSAGCVPVVFNGGGQPEIVTAGSSGLLWETLDGWIDATWRLAHDDALRTSLARQGIARAPTFAHQAFGGRVREIFGAP